MLVKASYPVAVLLLFLYFQPNYLPLNFSLFLGVLFAPFIIQKVGNRSHRFLVPALVLGGLLCFIQTNSIYYFFALLVLLYMLEAGWGRLNNLPLFLGLVLSYVSQQILNNWSFPIRLQLSAYVGEVIRFLGYQVEVTGNIIILDGMPFSVDPACMGLKMMVTAQLLALVMLGYYERKKQIVFSIKEISAYLVVAMGLTVVANFTRILALVLFHILPENPLHELMGLLALGVYVLLPIYFLLAFLLENRQAYQAQLKIRSVVNLVPAALPKITLIALLAIHGYLAKQPIPTITAPYPMAVLEDFTQSQTENGMLKLENDSTLIYIKPPVQFFQGNHDPRVCWSGSGYEFANIQVEQIGATSIYTAILKHKEDQFYTAWWYDNLQVQTIEEWQWRWDLFQGKQGYYLVNVSSLDRVNLRKQAKALLVNQ